MKRRRHVVEELLELVELYKSQADDPPGVPRFVSDGTIEARARRFIARRRARRRLAISLRRCAADLTTLARELESRNKR